MPKKTEKEICCSFVKEILVALTGRRLIGRFSFAEGYLDFGCNHKHTHTHKTNLETTERKLPQIFFHRADLEQMGPGWSICTVKVGFSYLRLFTLGEMEDEM